VPTVPVAESAVEPLVVSVPDLLNEDAAVKPGPTAAGAADFGAAVALAELVLLAEALLLAEAVALSDELAVGLDDDPDVGPTCAHAVPIGASAIAVQATPTVINARGPHRVRAPAGAAGFRFCCTDMIISI